MPDYVALMKARHSVRDYAPTPLSKEQRKAIEAFLDELNGKYGLHFRLIVDEDVFSRWMLGYGFIKGCRNYIRLAGKSAPDLEEKVGYYGEMVALFLQSLGLNTCWVGGTYRKKDVYEEPAGSVLVALLALGVGNTQGKPSSSRPIGAYYEDKDVPSWFLDGMEAALLSPSALNQKKWRFLYQEDGSVKATGNGKHFGAVDLGIAKLHFELGAKRTVFAFDNPWLSLDK